MLPSAHGGITAQPGQVLTSLHPATADRARFAGVYRIVARIPYGRVTTYGAIARALGPPRAGRTVGWAMHVAPAGLPCHRVVNHQGFLSGGWHFGHPDLMAGLLHDKNVPFRDRHRVDLRACLWDPDEDEPAHDLRYRSIFARLTASASDSAACRGLAAPWIALITATPSTPARITAPALATSMPPMPTDGIPAAAA